MTVHLFIPCLVEHVLPEVGLAAADCLAAAGCEVAVDPSAACCGQLFANAGFPDRARPLVLRFLRTYREAEAVVMPSGSCAGFLRDHGEGLLDDPADRAAWAGLRGRIHELTAFLAGRTGGRWAGSFPGRAVIHGSCHDPEARDATTALLAGIDGLERVADPPRECCGFGGAFWSAWRPVSAAMGRRRLETLTRDGPDLVVMGEPGCLAQVRLAARGRPALRVLHVAEVLAAAARTAGGPR